MFVRVLGSLWARSLPPNPSADAASPPGNDLGTWLRAVDAASPPDVGDLVVAAGPQRATSAARWLLARASSRLPEDGPDRWDEIATLGALLLRVVERGHGTDFPGGQLAIPHGRTLIGLGRHLSSPSSSRDAYQRAAWEYTSRGEPLLAAMAQLGAAAARWIVLLGGDQGEVHAQLAAIAEVDPAAAAKLGPPLDGYLRTLRAIAAVREGTPSNELDQEESHERDAEAVSLFKLAALSSLDDVAAASRLARAADELSTSLGEPSNVLSSVGESLLWQHRWRDAVTVLEECHNQHPQDRDTAVGLARAWLEMDRWDDARMLLVGLLADPPGPQDAFVLQLLHTEAYLRGDPQSQRWQDLLAEIDPSRTVDGMIPSSAVETPPEPLRAVFREGTLQVSEDLFELPEDQQRVHLRAAIVAGRPDGRQILTELFDSDPALADRVMHLLGFERVTAEEAQIRRHIEAGEEYFRHRRFEDAAREYQAAVDLDPDQATALLCLGDTWYRRRAYELAQAYFEESLAVAPSPQAFRFLGDAVVASGGSRERARQCYEEALRLDPSYGGAKVALQQLNDAEGEEERLAAWLGGRGPSLAGPAAAAAVGSPPETPGGGEAAAIPAPSVSPGLRWSDSRSPKPLPGQAKLAPRLWQPVLSRLPVAGGAPASALSSQDASPQDDRVESVGDRLVRAVAEWDPDSVVTVIYDDNSFSRWVAAASPDTIARAIFTVLSIAFQYEAKDRNLARWAHWVHREVQLAEALPADFGPDQAPAELGRDRLLGDAYAARASVLYAQGRLAEARGWWEHALDLLDAEQDARARAGLVGDPEFDRLFHPEGPRAALLERLARVCHGLGDTAAMLRYARQVYELNSARPTSESRIFIAIEGGDAALDRGDFDAALGAFHWALEQAEEDAPTQVVPRALARTLNALGRCHHRLQLNRSALAYFNRARRLNERSGNAVRLTLDFLEIGRIYRARPDLGEAREALEQSLRNASIPGTPADELSWTGHDGLTWRVTAADRAWEPLLELGSLLEDRGDLASAVAILDLATRIADVVRASAVDDAQRVALANQRIEAFAALTRLCLGRALANGPDAVSAAEDAWRANEAMRARSFLDALGDDELVVPPKVLPALVEQEAAALERRRRLIASGAHDVAFWDDLGRVQAELEAVWDRMLAVAPTLLGTLRCGGRSRRPRPTSAP